MKVILTKTEVVAILKKHLNLQAGDIINIDEFTLRDEADILLVKFRDSIERFDYRGSEKISAIKALRECCPGTGLAYAKYAIENYDRFIRFVRSYGRLPNDTEINALPL